MPTTVSSYAGALGLRQLSGQGFGSATPTAFRFNASTQQFGSVELVRVQARALGYRHEASGPFWSSRFACLFVQHGEIAVEAPHRVQSTALAVEGGQALIVPLWRPFALRCTRSVQWSCVYLDARAVEPMLPKVPERLIAIPGESGLASAAAVFGHALADSPRDLSDVERYATNQLLLEMCGTLMLNAVGLQEAHSSGSSVRDRALAVIAQRHTEADLSVAVLASAVSVSTRSLQAAFAEAGTTVVSELRRQRARTAASLLRDRAFDGLSVDAIALQSGFGCSLSMRRALSSFRHGTPSALRDARPDDQIAQRFVHRAQSSG